MSDPLAQEPYEANLIRLYKGPKNRKGRYVLK